MQKIGLWSLLIIFITVFVGLCPLKFAKKIENIKYDSEEYIVCKETRITDYFWERVIRYSHPINVYDVELGKMETTCFNFAKNSPLNDGFKIGIDDIYSINLFLVYGNQNSKELYTCDHWEILYPIRRNGVISSLLPKNYLCVFDVIGLP